MAGNCRQAFCQLVTVALDKEKQVQEITQKAQCTSQAQQAQKYGQGQIGEGGKI
jgi:hypothetical protein